MGIIGENAKLLVVDVDDLRRVEDVVGIEGLLDGADYLVFAGRRAALEVVELFVADAVFAGHLAA
ncbi:Uncharacterised protein [uncultured Ruminococcus sp.]|nr:Uncharacterised protein [uncultured Ruminococcus sp.]